MSLKTIHDKLEDIPENYQSLYTEKDGKQHLTGIIGIKTQADIDRMTASVNRERDEHKLTKDKYGIWGDMDHTKTMASLDRIKELELAASGDKEKIDERLEEMTSARLASVTAPMERQVAELTQKLTDSDTELQTLRTAAVKRTIDDNIRSAITDAKVAPGVSEDVLLLASVVFGVDPTSGEVITKENPYGVTPGLSSDVWLTEMKDKRPHWWPATEGGGATGSGGGSGGFGDNPFSDKSWNMTKQGEVINTLGRAKADQMAKAAGTTVGGPRPEPKQ